MPFAQLRHALLLCACMLALPVRASGPPAEVIVLSTLHQLHEEVPGYSYGDLAAAIERLEPDVLCVELRAQDLATRAPQKVKREYPAAIYPLIDRHGYRVYPLEPSEPEYSARVGPYVAANRAFAESKPSQAEALGRYGEGVYAGLRAYWTTPARANDVVTDHVMQAKHALQEAMIGAGEHDGWQGWNRYFLGVIQRAAAENPGKRIVVTVGAEHGYWLRGRLAGTPGLVLLDTAALLYAGAGEGPAAP